MSFPLSAIASIGGSIISGLFGKSAAKDAQKREDTSIQRRVEDAKKAGIHPLAALGANVSPVTAMPSVGSAFGEGIKEAAPLLSEKASLENDLLRAQIRQTDAATSVAAATSRSMIADATAKTRGLGDDGPDLANPLKPQRERSRVAIGPGVDLRTAGSADAQTAEDRYGNVIEEIWGIKNFLQDYWNSPDLPPRKGWRDITRKLSR